MSCAFCHVGPHPLNPPADPEEPKWENLSSVIGDQYFRTRTIVGGLLSSDNFLSQLLDSQLPGTIDTSLVATDNINNANTMNAIFELPERLRRAGAFLATEENVNRLKIRCTSMVPSWARTSPSNNPLLQFNFRRFCQTSLTRR